MKLCFKLILPLLIIFPVVCCESLLAKQPRLVLMITIDQLRGDMPWRVEQRFAPAGFRYFFEHGTVYINAHYEHLVTTTAAGHATLATGSYTPQHGIAANDWYDVLSRQTVYNTEDRQHPVLGVKAEPNEGRSPRNLTSSTVGDELVTASAGKSRVFSVSIKDRAAIIPGGKLGKAFWYSKPTGKFVSSSYYYAEYPQWVTRWNAADHAGDFRDKSWELLQDRNSYVFLDQDDRWFEKPAGKLGRTFPHPLANPDDEAFYSALRSTPMGDQLTLSFLKAMVTAEKVGSKGHTDMLAVSFSATDYIGHDFGPNSLEAEDNLLQLDQTLQELLRFIDDEVGLENTLIALSSDHGVAPAPEDMALLGIAAERLQPRQFMRQINDALRTRFKLDSDLALAFLKPGIYLDEPTIEALGLDLAQVEQAVVTEIMTIPGFSMAFSRSELLNGTVPDTYQARLAAHSIHPVRSGNVILIQDPYWFLSSDPDGDAATHGSPYNYDTHVPIMIAGPGIGSDRLNHRVSPRDLAPTVSAYLGIPAPSGATGTPLPGLRHKTDVFR
jgi:predicted AlkP superfamily pyrophosphatase or phosphodiesterase